MGRNHSCPRPCAFLPCAMAIIADTAGEVDDLWDILTMYRKTFQNVIGCLLVHLNIIRCRARNVSSRPHSVLDQLTPDQAYFPSSQLTAAQPCGRSTYQAWEICSSKDWSSFALNGSCSGRLADRCQDTSATGRSGTVCLFVAVSLSLICLMIYLQPCNRHN